ncbi:MAG: PAS domain S-box protein [Verrucomicrobiota bacterium]
MVTRRTTELRITNQALELEILEHQQTEKTLRDSEERFSGAFEHAPIGVALLSPDGRWLKVNRTLCDLVGYAEIELLARTFQAITFPADLAANLEVMQQLISGEILTCQFEKRYIHRKGHLITVLLNASLVRDRHGDPLYFIVQIQDITLRRQEEESLRLLSSAVAQSKEAILITNADLDFPGPGIVFVNPAFSRMTGYTAAEVIGKTPRILQGSLTDMTVIRRLRQNLERGEVFEGETINYRKNGTEFNLEWQIAPLRDEGGIITHFVAIQRDITHRKRLEAQLYQSQKMETVGKLAGGIAHEFNSILTAIIGQSELLLRELSAGSPLATNATEITSAASRAATLTRHLLAYGGRQMLRPEILDLNAVVDNAESSLRHVMRRETEIQVASAGDLKAVKADAGQMQQVLLNMAMNAADAMPDGGKLTFKTMNVSLNQDDVRDLPEAKSGDYVMLAISDTGSGMSGEVKDRIFEPFFTTRSTGMGSGLGLSICYGIIKQSGGHIVVDSEPARGTTFKIYLPQVDRPAILPDGILCKPSLPRGTETILLLEADGLMREMMAGLLRRLGYEVLLAANAVEAARLQPAAGTTNIDLLLTDVSMASGSGVELCDMLKTAFPDIRILLTTENLIAPGDAAMGSAPPLQRPFTPSGLAWRLREALNPAECPPK